MAQDQQNRESVSELQWRRGLIRVGIAATILYLGVWAYANKDNLYRAFAYLTAPEHASWSYSLANAPPQEMARLEGRTRYENIEESLPLESLSSEQVEMAVGPNSRILRREGRKNTIIIGGPWLSEDADIAPSPGKYVDIEWEEAIDMGSEFQKLSPIEQQLAIDAVAAKDRPTWAYNALRNPLKTLLPLVLLWFVIWIVARFQKQRHWS